MEQECLVIMIYDFSDSDDDSSSTPNFVFDQSKSDCTENDSDDPDVKYYKWSLKHLQLLYIDDICVME